MLSFQVRMKLMDKVWDQPRNSFAKLPHLGKQEGFVPEIPCLELLLIVTDLESV